MNRSSMEQAECTLIPTRLLLIADPIFLLSLNNFPPPLPLPPIIIGITSTICGMMCCVKPHFVSCV
jgi:hypothetical protein